MKLENIKQQLVELVEMTDKWLAQGYMPSIEKHISLARISEIYDALNDNTAAPRPVHTNQLPPAQTTQPVQLQHTVKPIQPEQQKQNLEQEQSYFTQQHEQQHVTEEYKTLLGQQIPAKLHSEFICELFWKDENFFNNEMRKFQDMQSHDQAIIYVTEKYNWAGNNLYAQKFIELIGTFFNQ